MSSFRPAALLGCVVLQACSPDRPPASTEWSLEMVPVPASDSARWSGVGPDGDGVLLSWIDHADAGSWVLRAARHGPDGWTEPVTVAREGEYGFFLNWADFPSVRATADGRWVAHWLERGATGGYDYGVRYVQSHDRGATWSDPLTPHEDGTPTEHGFVSLFDDGAGATGMVWLDGREMLGHDATGAHGPMTLRYRSVAPDGTPGPEELVDGRTCECCQTGAALTSAGPVVVYRNRTEDEVRDIYVTRRVDGVWTEGVPVHDDGWVFAACPVNGPAIRAEGSKVAVAWFTAANDDPRVQVAFSNDAAASFEAPIRADEGNPLGRADVLLLEDGSALVSWLARDPSGVGRVRVRRVHPDGTVDAVRTVAETSSERASGFPRMTLDARGRAVFTWTEAGAQRGVRMARTTSALLEPDVK